MPLFDTFGIQNPDMIGQASFFTAEPADGGWRVTFETGWGDCPAGCIDRHTWTWDVAEDGTITFVGEDGSPLAPEQLAALQASAQNRTGVAGRATGGPTCPVEQPGDPSCAGRMVSGAALVVRGADGTEVARFTTDGSGLFRIALPARRLHPGGRPRRGLHERPGAGAVHRHRRRRDLAGRPVRHGHPLTIPLRGARYRISWTPIASPLYTSRDPTGPDVM